jgi:hypothetical protein
MQENNVEDAYPSFHKNYWAIIFFISVFVKLTVLKRNRIFSISNSLYLVHFMFGFYLLDPTIYTLLHYLKILNNVVVCALLDV